MTSTQARNKGYRAQLKGDYAKATYYMETAKRLEAEEALRIADADYEFALSTGEEELIAVATERLNAALARVA